MAEDKRVFPGDRRTESARAFAELLERVSVLDEHWEHYELEHTIDHEELMRKLDANTLATLETARRLEPYLASIESIDRFASAIGIIANGLHWFLRRVAVWLRPIGLIFAIAVGLIGVLRVFRNGGLTDLIHAIMGLF